MLSQQLGQLLGIKVTAVSSEGALVLIWIQLTDDWLQKSADKMAIQLRMEALVRISPQAVVATAATRARTHKLK
ncbi:MAG: hypothetical protein ACKOCM_09330, partial [Cyanobacteriota bacterium]